MRSLLCLLLSAALVVSLTACGSGEPSSGSASSSAPAGSSSVQAPVDVPFSLAVYSSYSLHPVLAENRANLMLAPLLYEPLFQLDESFEPVCVLCSSYSASEDLLVWSFTLRSNVTFSDGTPLTGALAAEALNLSRQPESRYAQRLRDVSSVTGDDTSVTITLTTPNGDLPALLDIPIALGSGDHPAGTGPYLLSGQEDDLTLVARTDWWQNKSLPVAEIPLTPVDQSDDLISSFASGATGLVEVDLMGTNALGYSGNYQTWDYATTDFLYLGFNTQKGLGQTAAFRQAVAKTIDRTSIVQVDYARHAVETTLPLHPDSPLANAAALEEPLTYAPEEAISMLEELRATGRSFTLVVNSENSTKVAAAERIAYQLEAAGLEIILSRLPFEDYTAALQAGNFDLYLGEVVLTADFDLSPLLSSTGMLNYGRWQDGQTDLLLSGFRSASSAARAAASSALLSYLNDQVPIAPICFKHGSVLTQWGQLSGLSPVRGNVFYHLDGWIIE